jgi:hypothetical protein
MPGSGHPFDLGHDLVIDNDPAALAALRRGARTFR